MSGWCQIQTDRDKTASSSWYLLLRNLCVGERRRWSLPLDRTDKLPQRQRHDGDRKWRIKRRDHDRRVSEVERYKCLDGVGDGEIREAEHVQRNCHDAPTWRARV